MFDSIIFDMDGVLIDSEQVYFDRRMAFCKEHHLQPKSTFFLDYVGLAGKDTWKLIAPEDKDNEIRKIYERYREDHPIDFSKALRPEVPELLQALKAKGKKLAIASSSGLAQINEMLEVCQLTSSFDFVISGLDLKQSKPHPEIYQKSMEALGGRALAVEDSPVGIQSAKAAGLFTVALAQDFSVDQTQADRIITHLHELLEIV